MVERADTGQVRIAWTRAEFDAVREALEVTPNFEGRTDMRQLLRACARAPRRPSEVALPASAARRLSERMVPVDTVTAFARIKLARAVRAHGLGPRAGIRSARG